MVIPKYHVIAHLKDGKTVTALFDLDNSIQGNVLRYQRTDDGSLVTIPYDQVSHFKVEPWGEARQKAFDEAQERHQKLQEGVIAKYGVCVPDPSSDDETRRYLNNTTQHPSRPLFDVVELPKADLWPMTRAAIITGAGIVLGVLLWVFLS